MKRPIPIRTKLAAKQVGENLATWRKMHKLTSEQVAAKAAVSPQHAFAHRETATPQ